MTEIKKPQTLKPAAKPIETPTVAATPDTSTAPATADEFQFDDLPIPVRTAPRGKAAGASDVVRRLQAVPVGKSFLVPVTVPETITDATERAKAFKEGQRRTSNSLSGAIRRFKKTEPVKNFSIRSVGDATYGFGVRVFREPDNTPTI